MEVNRLEIVDLELEDDILKGVEVIDPYPKGKKSEHGLPEHQWCPKKENSTEALETETKVILFYKILAIILCTFKEVRFGIFQRFLC